MGTLNVASRKAHQFPGRLHSELATLDSASLHCVEEGARLRASLNDVRQIVEYALGHRIGCQVLAGDAETTGFVSLDCPSLTGLDAFVFGERYPVPVRGQGEPVFVRDGFVFRDFRSVRRVSSLADHVLAAVWELARGPGFDPRRVQAARQDETRKTSSR